MRRMILLLLACLAPAAPAFAVDPPHWSSVNTYENCTTSCHAVHNALGDTITQATSNVNLCQSCHNQAGQAHNMPLNNVDTAAPGQKGTSHSFDVSAVNPSCGADSPLDVEMDQRIMIGRVVCSTCHNQHYAVSTTGGTSHISAVEQVTVLGSTGAVSAGGTFSGAAGVWYLLEIQTSGALNTATFRYSKDNGTTWMASGLTTAASVLLDSSVYAQFSAGNYVTGERYQFYAAWPFLRIALDSGDNTTGAKMCRDCHRSWTMDATGVETYDGSYKSHPVGVALTSNGRGYDRSIPLDGNGATQGTPQADTNATNDLKVDSTSSVQCWTCHGLHYADSNTVTQDGP